jgi:3-deoxy-manno-octulosonate cytidylyltransferase (CMP-KDO synthetase)
MKKIAVIPARYASTRFPAKLVQDLCGKPVILRTFEAAVSTQLFDEVWVVTDSQEIYNLIETAGGKVFLSRKEHESGSDRIAEAVTEIDADIVVNVQGDEPFIDKESLALLLNIFHHDSEHQIDLASLMTPLSLPEDIQNPNHVKVVTDLNGLALYFSRAPIPFPREGKWEASYFKHIGIYAFRKSALMDFSTWPVSMLEATEKLEQLRYLEHGKKIKMVVTHHVGIGIDTPEDLKKARELFKKN